MVDEIVLLVGSGNGNATIAFIFFRVLAVLQFIYAAFLHSLNEGKIKFNAVLEAMLFLLK